MAKVKNKNEVSNLLKEQQRPQEYYQTETGDKREIRADRSKRGLNTFSADYEICLQRYNELLPSKVRKNAVHGLNFVISTSKEFDSKDKESEYYEAARQFIENRFGVIVGWAIHRDETSTHMQVITIPLKDGKLNARALCGGSKYRMNEFQDDFFSEVGEKFGLERGERDSLNVHTTVEEYHRQEKEKFEEKKKELNQKKENLEQRELFFNKKEQELNREKEKIVEVIRKNQTWTKSLNQREEDLKKREEKMQKIKKWIILKFGEINQIKQKIENWIRKDYEGVKTKELKETLIKTQAIISPEEADKLLANLNPHKAQKRKKVNDYDMER